LRSRRLDRVPAGSGVGQANNESTAKVPPIGNNGFLNGVVQNMQSTAVVGNANHHQHS
jgi:hypothetical protein